jgi:hypothetical protein
MIRSPRHQSAYLRCSQFPLRHDCSAWHLMDGAQFHQAHPPGRRRRAASVWLDLVQLGVHADVRRLHVNERNRYREFGVFELAQRRCFSDPATVREIQI